MAKSPKIFHEPEGLEQKEVTASVKQNWAQRARTSNWVLALEIGAVAVTVVALIFACLQFMEQVKGQ